ncbi:hypothetical protein AAMO2058_000938300 [Amorphochlora amoebiformis]
MGGRRRIFEIQSGRTYGVSPGDTIWFVKNRLGFSVERLSLNEAFQRDQSPTPEPEDIVDQSVAPSSEPSIPTSAPQSPPIETSSEDQVGADGITTAFDSQMDIAQDSLAPNIPTDGWACAVCTVVNGSSCVFCDVCGSPQPNYEPPDPNPKHIPESKPKPKPQPSEMTPPAQHNNSKTNQSKSKPSPPVNTPKASTTDKRPSNHNLSESKSIEKSKTAGLENKLKPIVIDAKKDGDSWKCLVCTLVNPNRREFCNVCGSPKPEGDTPHEHHKDMHTQNEPMDLEKIWQCVTCLGLNPDETPFCKVCRTPRMVTTTEEDKRRKAYLEKQAKSRIASRRRERAEAKVNVEEKESVFMQRDGKVVDSSVGTTGPLPPNITLPHPRATWDEYKRRSKADKGPKDSKEKAQGLIDTEVELIEIPKGSSAFNMVNQKFSRESGSFCLVKLEAIKSPIRYGAYMYKREVFREELGKFLNEQWLWHGTSEKIVLNIAHQGFLRQFLGSATDYGFYGCGIYFAPNAGTSCSYARAGSDGLRRMLLCRVLVGQYHKGYQGLKQPKAKPGSKYKPHECTVDNVYNPSEYVIYQDDQAYPEFLLTFTTNCSRMGTGFL